MDEARAQEEINKYKKFRKVDGATYRKVNQFLRKRTYITAREWALARLCTDFRTTGGAEMTFIGAHLPQLVPFMEDTYSPQAVNQARNSFKKKVRKSSATFFYGAMCGFFTTEELDDLLFEASEVARFLLEVESTTLDIDEEIDIEDRITGVMRSVGEAAKTVLKTRGMETAVETGAQPAAPPDTATGAPPAMEAPPAPGAVRRRRKRAIREQKVQAPAPAPAGTPAPATGPEPAMPAAIEENGAGVPVKPEEPVPVQEPSAGDTPTSPAPPAPALEPTPEITIPVQNQEPSPLPVPGESQGPVPGTAPVPPVTPFPHVEDETREPAPEPAFPEPEPAPEKIPVKTPVTTGEPAQEPHDPDPAGTKDRGDPQA